MVKLYSPDGDTGLRPCFFPRSMEWRVAVRVVDPESPGIGEGAPFLMKRLFGYWKVRYRGLVKNTERLALLFGLGNL